MAARSTPATLLLTRGQVAHRLHEYHHDPRSRSYGDEAVDGMGVPAEQVFKTLVALVWEATPRGSIAGGGSAEERTEGRSRPMGYSSAPQPAIGAVPVPASLDLRAMAAALGGRRAILADPADAERMTGYVRGGISPLGQRRRLPTVIDTSASGYDTIFVSAGRRGLELELAPADLLRLTGAVLAPIAS